MQDGSGTKISDSNLAKKGLDPDSDPDQQLCLNVIFTSVDIKVIIKELCREKTKEAVDSFLKNRRLLKNSKLPLWS